MPEGTILDGLNDKQREGVLATEGPVLILAGAGSGKTRVLTYRTAHLIKDLGVNPSNIMAITFTNKAANEMKERIYSLTGTDEGGVWVSTFHSACVRILRRFADRIGYSGHFTIYDSEDSKTLMKHILKDMNIDSKKFKEKSFLKTISDAKNELIGAVDYSNRHCYDFKEKMNIQVYMEYESRLKTNNAFDFDDLIMKTVELFKADPEVLNYYQEKLHYVMVDEYQDTNTAQFELIKLLAGGRRNLCVVGDDDQSIYKFRGANIYNILNFEDYFPDAKVIKLEQNYRSTQMILDAANSVIANNSGRKEKSLWTSETGGDKIVYKQFDSAYEEAQYIAFDIASKKHSGRYSYSEDAILYRTNAQSRILEEKLINENIPYKIIGGTNFYSRMEIKDILAYLKVVDNGWDEVSVRRIINSPKRGIGNATLQKVSLYASVNGLSFYEALEKSEEIPGIGKTSQKIKEFTKLIDLLRLSEKKDTVPEVVKLAMEFSGYRAALEAENTEEARGRIENLEELYAKAVTYDQSAGEPSLSGFLEDVALVAEVDSLDEDSDYVVLMTLHSAKGLEFSNVYMVGMEDGLFPGFMSISSGNPEDIEEERRLCYVGITRARKHLTMTSARMRMLRGETQFATTSRFVKEIPGKLLDGNTYDPSVSSRNSMTADSTFSFSSYRKDRREIKTDYGSAGSAFDSSSDKKSSDYGNRRKYGASSYGANLYSSLSGSHSGSPVQKNTLDYNEGDRVRHRKFGDGTVKVIADGKKDYEITVEFDSAGVKKMLASFAKLEKI